MNRFFVFVNRIVGESERTRKAVKNVSLSLCLKGISVIISFAMVPLLIGKLTTNTYGIWLTLTSLISMLSFSDIGLGNGLKNLLSESIANRDIDNARKLVSTAYIAISTICTLLFIFLLTIGWFLNWALILNAPLEMKHELKVLVLFIFFFFCLQLILNLVTSILQAHQQSSLSDLINVGGQLFAFLAVLAISSNMYNASLFEYGVALYSIPVLVLFISTLILFRNNFILIKPSFKFFEKKYLKKLCFMGGKFFLIQLTALLLYQSNNLIIAQTSGNSDVAVYNIVYKYAGVTLMVFTIILSPIWAATTDAFVKRDFNWIKKAIVYLNKIWLLLILICIVQFLIANRMYELWVGSDIKVDPIITMLALLYFVLSMKAGIYCNVINGTGRIFMQFLIYTLQVIIHIPTAIYLGNLMGIKGVLISMCIIMFLNILWMKKQCEMLINETACGLWAK